MAPITRRSFLKAATMFGASAAWGNSFATPLLVQWRERRNLFPEGVASGDPDSNSVLLWTRRPPANGKTVTRLRLEVAEDESFRRVVATADASISEVSDWT